MKTLGFILIISFRLTLLQAQENPVDSLQKEILHATSDTSKVQALSYDIIKSHGGEIKVQTKESEGAEFIIQLPVADHGLEA